MKKIHLVCNAHLDPVWLWDWQEAAAEAVSTFSVAADFCEEFDGFVFNHNEVVLYKWIEEYEPGLFKRIRKLVSRGKWHIMGGWYLQPDCNMSSGESLIRQVLLGRNYFWKKFKVNPTTAINFDPFGHSRGLVQILAKSGYDSYLFCRPQQNDCPLERDLFVWEGYDGSRVKALRAFDMYFTFRGDAVPKVKKCLEKYPGWESNLVLWGLGNHGGGPSRADLEAISGFMKESAKEIKIIHSTPEAFFNEIESGKLPVCSKPLNKWAVGCYISQIRIKQQHRKLEGELFSTEKMFANAWGQGLLKYPEKELSEVEEILAYSEFHDILPGSSVQTVEETSLGQISQGLEMLSKLKTRAFFALSSGQTKARDGLIPVFAYNPHPYPVKAMIECEFNLPVQNWAGKTFFEVEAMNGRKGLPTQVEKEEGNLQLEWRKRVVFQAVLKPSKMNRFDCRLIEVPSRRGMEIQEENGRFIFKNKTRTVAINSRTGLLESYVVDGFEHIGKPSCLPIVLDDDEDSWKMTIQKFGGRIGEFKVLSEKDAAYYSGSRRTLLNPVRIIEDGDARTVVEVLLGYEHSYACLQYKIPKHDTRIEIFLRVNWAEKDKLLKLAFNPASGNSDFIGQAVFGTERFSSDGQEFVYQKWGMVLDRGSGRAMSIINDGIYGANFRNGEVGLSLLRSTAYAGHPFPGKDVVPQDRFVPRQEQGERFFTFWLDAGDSAEMLKTIDREAQSRNEKPVVLSFFPYGGRKEAIGKFLKISDSSIVVSAIKKSTQKKSSMIVRLFEPTGLGGSTILKSEVLGIRKRIVLAPYEVKTIEIGLKDRRIREVSMMEK